MDTLSWQQFRALWKLKLRLLLRFWQGRGQLYRLSLYLSVGISTLLACALGVGVGFLIHLRLPTGPGMEMLPELMQYLWLGVFTTLSVVWLISPILFMMKNESLTLDISRLTRYPISYHTLHRFHTLLALMEPWNLFFYPVGLGILVGSISRNGLRLLGPTLILILLWLLMHILWSKLLQDLITVLFTSRYLREILTLSLILLIILLSFVPAMLSENTALQGIQDINAPSLEIFLYQWPFWHQLQPILDFLLCATPAGWFAHALSALFQEQWQGWLEGCGVLFAWIVLANLLDLALLRRLFSEPPSQARKQNLAELNLKGGFLQYLMPHALRVMILKELRTYFRSILGKLSFFLTPLLVGVLRLAGLGSSQHLPAASLLLGMIVYIFMTSLFLYINYFGPDHEGFKLYLLAAVPQRRLILAKNLALTLFASAEFAVVLVIFVLLYRQLDLQTLCFGLCSFASLLLGVLSMGNLLSVRFPSALDLNQTQYRQSNGTPILLGLQVLTLLALITSSPLWLSFFFREPLWLLSLGLTLLLALSWWLILPVAEGILNENRWQILEAVSGKD